MADIARRMVWFAFVATAVSYAIFAVLGNFAAASAADRGAVPIRDVIEPGVHHLSGILMVPATCDELSVEMQMFSTSTYELVFTTWKDPSIQCSDDATPREFRATAFAPGAGVTFLATLDGRSFPISVISDLSTSSESS